MRNSSRVNALKSVPLFAAFAERELEAVAKVIEVVDVLAGDVLVKQGARGHEFYVISGGQAEVILDGATVATLKAGDFFGELAVLDPQPRTATVQMSASGQVMILSEREFFSLLSSAPTLSRKLLIGLARRLHAQRSAPPCSTPRSSTPPDAPAPPNRPCPTQPTTPPRRSPPPLSAARR